DDAWVAHAEPPFGLGAVRCADIHPELGHFRRLVAIGRLHEMNRLLADHAHDVAVATHEADALAHENLRVPAADGGRVDEALIVDVLHDQPDLVDVAVEHDGR